MTHVMTATILALGMTTATAASAEPVRLLIAAGSQKGLAAERPLKFAHADAARVRDIFVRYGSMRPRDAEVLREPSRAELASAFARAQAEAARHKPDEVTIVFYFSGHGDREAIHLGDERVLLSDVQAELAKVPAALRIVVTDACRTTREKGFTAEEPFAISLGASPQASGSVWLHASSDGESAQESDELEGAIFTHAWLNGLRGAADANGDARVTLDESFAFAHAQTMIRSSKSSGVLQKPEAIVNLRELAPVVLTETSPRLSAFSLPTGRDVHYLVYTAGATSVLAELWGAPERRTAFHVPAGRYVVFRRVAGQGGAAHIELANGEERALAPSDFAPVSLDVIAQKGGDAVHPHEVDAAFEIGTSKRFGLSEGARLGYSYALTPTFALTLGAGVAASSPRGSANQEHVVGGTARIGAELRFPLARNVSFLAGAGAHAGVLWQTVVRADASIVELDGYAAQRTERAFTAGPEVLAGLRLATDATGKRALFGELTLGGRASLLQQDGVIHTVLGATLASGVGAMF